MSIPDPVGGNAARLAADRKRDEDVFKARQAAQEKERKAQHARVVTDKINHIQRDLDRKKIELGAIKTETPRLEEKIEKSKRTERDLSRNTNSEEDRKVRELTTTLENLQRNEKDLERQLETLEREEHRTEDELRRHTSIKEDKDREQERTKSTAEEDGRTAKRRLEEQERKARTLESEIRKMEDEIAALKREIR